MLRAADLRPVIILFVSLKRKEDKKKKHPLNTAADRFQADAQEANLLALTKSHTPLFWFGILVWLVSFIQRSGSPRLKVGEGRIKKTCFLCLC